MQSSTSPRHRHARRQGSTSARVKTGRSFSKNSAFTIPAAREVDDWEPGKKSLRVVVENPDLDSAAGVDQSNLKPRQPRVGIASSISKIRFNVENPSAYSDVAVRETEKTDLERIVEATYGDESGLGKVVVRHAVFKRNRCQRRILAKAERANGHDGIRLPMDHL